MGPKDVRFTRNKANSVIYAIILGWPAEETLITSLGSSSDPGKILKVSVLGSDATVKWTQEAGALRVQLPGQRYSANDYGAALKIALR